MEHGFLPATDDAQLLVRVRQGDLAAFDVLVDRYGAGLLATARGLVNSPADAEDVLQEALVGAFRSAGRFRGESSVKTWLTRIVMVQAALHRRRNRRRQATKSLDTAAGVPAARGAPVEQAERRMDVAAMLRQLSAEHRQVLVLRELQGLSYEEMAEVLGVPQGTVESRLFRARREMRQRFAGYWPEQEPTS